jgi:hypothetical protein
MSKINDLQYWRRRAEEAGTLAEELTDPDAKRKMLKIAKDYETLARRPEQRLRHHSSATIRNWRRYLEVGSYVAPLSEDIDLK